MHPANFALSRGARFLAAVACVTCALLAAPRPLAAQAPRTITFTEAIRIALERNTTLRRAANASAADDIAVQRARLAFLPRLSASSQGSQGFGSASGEETRSLSASLSSDVTLFDGFGNVASLREARLSQSASRLDVRQSRRTVVFTVVSNYLALIQQQEQLGVQRENLAAADTLERQIREYVAAGSRTVADLYQQQAAAAGARLAVVEADRGWQLAQADLLQTLQLEAGQALVFEPPALLDGTAEAASPDLDSLLRRAYRQRTDLAAEQARAEAARQSVRVAGAAGWPSLSLSAGYGSSFTTASDVSFSGQFEERRGGSIGLGLSLPLFDRGANLSAVKLARLQADNSDLTLENQRQTVGIEVQRAWLNLRSAQEQLRVAQAQQKAAELSLQTSQERYEAGAATFVELSQTRATWVQAESQLVTARYNLLFQRALLDYYVGEDDPAASLAR